MPAVQRLKKSSKCGRQHVAHKNHYDKQRYRTGANKKKAWTKHRAAHPNDKQFLAFMKRQDDITYGVGQGV